jgi:hypothetical protein
VTESSVQQVERALARMDEVEGRIASVCTRNPAALAVARVGDG